MTVVGAYRRESFASMATTIQQPTSGPLHGFGASPPSGRFFDIPTTPGQEIPGQNGNGTHVQHRLSTDFKNGRAPDYANGNGAMPVPGGMHLNGGSRHGGTVSVGAFDGPRSPPNTKSTL